MKIILLGGYGQLGREWQRFIARSNQDIELRAYSSGELDITDFDKTRKEIRDQKPDIVINCAAYTGVDQAEKEQKRAHLVNAVAVEKLALVCQNVECKLVHYSTDYVFPGRKKDKKENPSGYPEDYPADPVNWYGQTKWEGEEAIRQVSGNHLVIRISWLCGQYGKNFVKTMLNAGKERDHLKVVNDQWGSPAFAENVVENTFVLLKAGKEGTYHITSNGLTTWYDIAGSIFEFEDIEVELNAVTSKEYPTEAKRPFFSKLDTRKIQLVPGIVLEDWEEGLRKLLDRLENR